MYVVKSGDAEARKGSAAGMAYGILAIFIMVSVWGLVNLLSGTIDLGSNGAPTDLPRVPTITQ